MQGFSYVFLNKGHERNKKTCLTNFGGHTEMGSNCTILWVKENPLCTVTHALTHVYVSLQPDSSQIVGRLMQIRDYIKQTSSMMESLRKTGDTVSKLVVPLGLP